MCAQKNDRITGGIIVVTALFATSVGAVEVLSPRVLRRIGLSLTDVLGGFFVAIAVVIAVLVWRQISYGATYIQGANGPFTRRSDGNLFWFHIVVESVIALLVGAVGILAILGCLPP